jgi:hypothetical protein
MFRLIEDRLGGVISQIRTALAGRVASGKEPASPTRHAPVDAGLHVRPLGTGLSAAAARDPVLLGLSPEFLQPGTPPDPETYGVVRTIGEKTGLPGEMIAPMQEAYATCIRKLRIFVSHPDEFPGLRRAIILGPLWDGSMTTQESTFIGVTRDGLLFSRRLVERESLGATLDAVRNSPATVFSPLSGRPLNLNRWGREGRMDASFPADVIFGAMTGSVERQCDGVIPKRFFGAFHRVTRDRLEERLRLVRFAISNALDPEILRMMRGSAMTRVSDAEWFSGARLPEFPEAPHGGEDRWFGVPASALHDREISRARRQAVAAYPALARVLMEGVTETIDARAPLAPEIARILGVEERQVRLVQGLTWQRAGVQPSAPIEGLSRIAAVPPDFRPATREEHRQIPLISHLATTLNLGVPEMMRRLGAGGSPYRFGKDLRAHSPGDIMDAARYLADKLIVPARLHAIKSFCEKPENLIEFGQRLSWHGTLVTEVIARDFLRTLSPREMFSLSESWHRNLQRHEDRIVELSLEKRWTPLLGTADCEASIVARELSSALELKTQGRREGHCVGGYADKVLRADGRSFTSIFSLEKDGGVLATVEILMARRRTASGPAWVAEVVQNRARNNGAPAPEAVRAADVLCARMAAMPEDEISAHVSGLFRMRRRSLEAKLPRHLEKAGYDIWDRGRLEVAWDELSGHLPRRLRKAGLDAFIAGQDLSDAAFTTRSGVPSTPFWERDGAAIAAFLDPGDAVRDGVRSPGDLKDAPDTNFGEPCPFAPWTDGPEDPDRGIPF